ncbi:phage tail sheath C-terminal domain-containing protein [Rouxiella sp. T17]|uniref:phage tail sheath C-terminal domain-containing protein n=1 Tax=Rouxiella sp. T17 TaxID=3085684 RepID=UPI002FC71D68
MARAVFEPNTPATWEILRSAVDVYLHNLWKQGALFGDKPELAYFVKVGLGITMDKEDINAGKLIIKVGMAPVSPAEFIVLEFSQKQL